MPIGQLSHTADVVSSTIYTQTHITAVTHTCSLHYGHSRNTPLCYIEQDAQLSQRDRAAGCVIVFAKSRRLQLGDNILQTL